MDVSCQVKIPVLAALFVLFIATGCVQGAIPSFTETGLFSPPIKGPGVAEYAMAEKLLPQNAIPSVYNVNCEPQWISDTPLFWYTAETPNGTGYFLVNVTAREQSPISPDALAGIQGAGTGPEQDPALLVSPDGTKGVYLQDNNIVLRDLASGKETALTTDGTVDYFYGRQSDTTLEIVSQQRSGNPIVPYAAWSPDSTRLATWKVNQERVLPLTLLQYAPENNTLRPIPYTYHYSLPGDEFVAQYEPVIIDTRNSRVIRMDYLPWPETSMMDSGIFNLQWWNRDGSQVYALYVERGEKTLRFLVADSATGSTKEVINETGPTYLESNLDYGAIPNIYVYSGNGDIIWFSERDGYGHLYLYDTEGVLKNRITSGDWVVRTLVYVDEDEGWIYFTASGREPGEDPYYRHLYRVHPDGSGLILLTPGDADHAITFAPDGSCFIDSYSRVDMPPVTVLRSPDGDALLELERADISYLTDLGWVPPERIRFKATDGVTDLYGLVYYPTGFDPKKTYPVVDVVYPGPQITVTAKAFPSQFDYDSKIFWRCQAIAELGFIVVNIDGLGTPFRSKPFHDVSYGHLGDAGDIADHVRGITLLSADRPFMDLDRVGIVGHSGGGFMTAQALLTYPGFFRVGVASAGNQDNRLYESLWGEKYEGMPVGDNYLEQVTYLKASNLTGNLLLVTGDVDDNVHPSMSLQLANAFIEQNKTFDMLVLTNRNHEYNYDPYFMKRQFDYLVLHLIGTEPPKYIFNVPWMPD